ncbi:MAG TPA: sulfate ABC transporter permease subunit CysW, partial [Actinomycetota bacterium]
MSAFPHTSEPARTVNAPGTAKRRLVRGGIVGLCFLYVGVLLLLPLVGIVWTAFEPGVKAVLDTFKRPDVQHAFVLTAIITAITLVVTTFFGVITAWVLVRQRFPGKSLLNALVDLPFALSPVTVGLAATILFGLGGWLYPFFHDRDISILFALPSMVLVTIFICIPFTIREVVP